MCAADLPIENGGVSSSKLFLVAVVATARTTVVVRLGAALPAASTARAVVALLLGSFGACRGIRFVQTVEADLAGLLVDVDDLDLDDVALGQDVFDLADTAVGHAADVEHKRLLFTAIFLYSKYYN